jgi:hypothetical protein
MHDTWFGSGFYVVSTNFGRDLTRNLRNSSLSSVAMIQFTLRFFSLDKSNILNDVPENDEFDTVNII